MYSASAPKLKDPPESFHLLTNPSHDAAVTLIKPVQLESPHKLPKILKGRGFVFKRLLSLDEKRERELNMAGMLKDFSFFPEGTREQAEILAREYLEDYQTFKLALNDHVATTLIIVGYPSQDDGADKEELPTGYRAQVFQELVKTTSEWLETDINSKDIQVVNGRSTGELRKLRIAKFRRIADVLEGRRTAIERFQQAFVQSVLLGLIPDLNLTRDKTNNTVSDIGMLFNSNCGENSKGEFVFFDFGTPRIDVLDNDQRQRLLNLMKEKASGPNSELPVIIYEQVDEQGNPYYRKVRIADWYKQALEEELDKSIKKPSGEIKIGPQEYLNFITRAFEMSYDFDVEKNKWVSFSGMKSSPYWQVFEKIGDFGTTYLWGPENLAYAVDALRVLSQDWFGTSVKKMEKVDGSEKTTTITPRRFINDILGRPHKRE